MENKINKDDLKRIGKQILSTAVVGGISGGLVGYGAKRLKLPGSNGIGKQTNVSIYSLIPQIAASKYYANKAKKEAAESIPYGSNLPETTRNRQNISGGILGLGGARTGLNLSRGMGIKGRLASTLGMGALAGVAGYSGAGATYSDDEKAYLMGARTKGTPESMAMEIANNRASSEIADMREKAMKRMQRKSENIMSNVESNARDKYDKLKKIYGA